MRRRPMPCGRVSMIGLSMISRPRSGSFMLCSLGLSEGELDDVLYYGLGSSYQVSGQTHAAWLEEVARQLEEAVDARIAGGR
jgi:hypothetical protein